MPIAFGFISGESRIGIVVALLVATGVVSIDAAPRRARTPGHDNHFHFDMAPFRMVEIYERGQPLTASAPAPERTSDLP